MSILASASIKSGQETMSDAFYRTYEASSEGNLQSSYDYDSYSRKLDIAALADIDYTLREHDNIGLTVFFARNAKGTFLDRTGEDLHERVFPRRHQSGIAFLYAPELSGFRTSRGR